MRELGTEDWADWRELRLAALRDAPEAFGATLADWQGEGDSERRWRARLDSGHNVLAHLDGVPAGMVSGMPRGHRVVLASMWVAPFARGRGVGDALVAAVVERAEGTVFLDVVRTNTVAAALYRRHGFVDDGPGDGDLRRMVRHPSRSRLAPRAHP